MDVFVIADVPVTKKQRCKGHPGIMELLGGRCTVHISNFDTVPCSLEGGPVYTRTSKELLLLDILAHICVT